MKNKSTEVAEAPKKNKRKSVVASFSISEETYDKFEKFFEDNCIDKSRLIEKLILEHMAKA